MTRLPFVAWFAIACVGAASFAACSSSNDASDSGDAGALDANADANFDLCATFSGSGTSCPLASTTTMCAIASCAASPCYCVQGPDGLRWACVNGTCGAPPPPPPPGSDAGGPAPDGGGAPTDSGGGGQDAHPPPADTGPPPQDSGGGVDADDGAVDDGATE